MSTILKCQTCGNLALSPPKNMGDRCEKNGCWGTLSFFANSMTVSPKQLMLQCKKCGNVYKAGPNRKIFDTCNVNGCSGKLDRYWG